MVIRSDLLSNQADEVMIGQSLPLADIIEILPHLVADVGITKTTQELMHV